MKTDKQNYYESEVNKINFHLEYPAQIKLSDNNGNTKWLSLNEESAKIIIDKLKKEFNIK
jgi:adenine specific DNA methylase Mod